MTAAGCKLSLHCQCQLLSQKWDAFSSGLDAALVTCLSVSGCLLQTGFCVKALIGLTCQAVSKQMTASICSSCGFNASMQVSSNAWELRGELASAYLLEQLTHSRRQAGLEAHPPEDDPDSWVETPYAMLMPCDICGPDDPRCNGTWQRPWADEMLVSCLASSSVMEILSL